MWTKKRGLLWVFDDGPAQRIADRPYLITIALSAISTGLAAVAVFVSYDALQTGQQTLKVANRAYVDVVSGSLQFSNYGVVHEKSDSRQHLVVRMDLSATIHNAGNSPASGGPFKRTYHRLPEGWSEAPAWLKKRLGPATIGNIGPRSTVNWPYTDLFELTPDAYHAFRNFPGTVFIYVDAAFTYEDVFGETTNIKWCWVAETNERRTEMTVCDSVQQLAVPLRR